MTASDSPSAADLELLAALADGRLKGAVKRRLLERLAADDGLREVFAETLAFQEDARSGGGLEPRDRPSRQGGAGATRRSRLRYGPWLLLPLAAAAALAVITFGPRLFDRSADLQLARVTPVLADGAVAGQLGLRWYEMGWSVKRGAEEVPERAQDGWFRVGVRLVDTPFALAAGRMDDAIVLCIRTEALLRALDPVGGLDGELELGRLELQASGDPDRLRDALEAVDAVVAERAAVSRSYLLGKWSESGRLSALLGNEELLTRRGFRALADSGSVTDAERRATLNRIAARLDGPLDESAMAALVDDFSRLIALH